MYRKLVALLLVMPFFAQNVYSEIEEANTTEDEQSTNTKNDDINSISKKIERKDFLKKELDEIPNRISKCENNDELEELSKMLVNYQNELIAIEDEETRAGISFRQRRYEADAIKSKDTEEIRLLINKLKERRKGLLGRQNLAQDKLQRATKNTSPRDKAIFRENLNNVNLGIINLDAKIKELEQIVAKLDAEELTELRKKQKTLQEQLEKLRNNFPRNNGDRDRDAQTEAVKKWREDMWKVSTELLSVNSKLESMTKQNGDVPSE